MSLQPGTRLGPYEVTAQIGAGGMGEVYRATDTNLKRAVALKVLPESVAGDAERLARFQREAEVLASLNHPNIAHIYGIEKSASVTALVLELVEGPTLADRIGLGTIALREALAIAKGIARALDAAHERGIIHRDLKPANIKVREDLTVTVLDFGLAKLAVSEASGATPALSQSPTLTTPAATIGSVILGTAAYMSPEQARGKPVDKRTDIWAFGVVVYEMLTGERLFKGEDIGEILAAVIKDEPRLDRVPANVRPLLQRCLERDPKKRLRDIGDVDMLLDQQQPQAMNARRVSWLWPAAAALLLLVASTLALVHFRETLPVEKTLRFQISPPAAAQMLTLSPDGTYLSFIAGDGSASKVWVRAMDALDARPLEGTDGATYPFWSPDGRSLGFFAQKKLKTIARAGGSVQTLCDASSGRGGSWSRTGVIVFSPAPFSPILRVSAAGGEPTPVTKTVGNDGHRFPSFLPDGRHFLYNGVSGLLVGSLEGTEVVQLLPDATNGLYAPGDVPGNSGFLLFLRANTLMAQPFDASGLRTTGEMFPIAQQVLPGSGSIGFGAFSVTANGILAYQTRGSAGSRQLVWLDRTGKRLSAATEPVSIDGQYSLSPDGKTLAMAINAANAGAGNSDIWLQDLERGVRTRLTFDGAANRGPVWSPDGSRVAFSVSTDPYSSAIYQQSATGSDKEALSPRIGVGGQATDWSPDGKLIVFQQTVPKTATDLWLLPLAGDHMSTPYLQTPFNEHEARFSPSSVGGSSWIAYQSDESGQNQVFVRAIPASGTKYQVSTIGGTFPNWRQDGRELFYLSADQKVVATSITLGASVQIGTPQELFTMAAMTYFVPSRDGQRFLVNLPAAGDVAPGAPITVITNWQTGLKK